MQRQDPFSRDERRDFRTSRSTDDHSAEFREQEARDAAEIAARKRKWLTVFIAVFSVVLCAVLVSVLVLSMRRESGTAIRGEPKEPLHKPPLSDEDAQTIWSTILEARETSDRFFAAKAMGKRAECVRDSARVLPLMKEFYSRTEFGKYEPKRIGVEAAYQLDHPESDRALVFTWAIMSDYTRRLFVCERSGDGAVRIDWESLVGYCTMSWETFRQERPTQPQTFRVLASESDYFVSPFDDSATAAAFRLGDLARRQTIFGYCATGSDVEQRIRRHLKPGKDNYLTLEVRFPEDPQADNQVEILRLLAPNWVMGFSDEPTFTPSRFLLLKES